MTRIAVVILFALTFASLSACQAPTADQAAAADFGERPADYQERIKRYFNVNEAAYAGYIKPDWRFKQPFKASFKEAKSDQWHFGYGVEMTFNRKRELQGYAPNERHVFFFADRQMWPVNHGDLLKRME